jgi:hypothetical protein
VDFKEALIFAFLGLLRWRGSINCLASVTGALTRPLNRENIYPKFMDWLRLFLLWKSKIYFTKDLNSN